VGVGQGGGRLQAELDDHGGGHRPAAAQRAQVDPVDVVRHVKARALVGVLAIDDARDVLVLEPREHVGLAAEAIDRIAGQVSAHDLDHHAHAERGVLGLVDRRHSAAADLVAQQVAPGEQLAHVFLRGLWRALLQGPPGQLVGHRRGAHGRSRSRHGHPCSVPAHGEGVNHTVARATAPI
jgi:hypothetical protein